MAHPKVVSPEEWLLARKAHLKNEKALPHLMKRHDEYEAVASRSCCQTEMRSDAA